MARKICHAMLLLLMLLSNGSSFGRRKYHKKSQENEQDTKKTIVYNPLTDPCAPAVEHHCDCGLMGFGIIQKIPYLQACSKCNTINIDFSSACISCGMCIAIAEKINETMLEVHDMLPSNVWLNDTEVVLFLRTICDLAFTHYGLREIDGRRCISDRVPGATLISTSADGLWGEKLKGMCHEYLDEIGELQLYKYWQQWCENDETDNDLIMILCRNFHGILRACRSMERFDSYEIPSKEYRTKVKIIAEYDKHG